MLPTNLPQMRKQDDKGKLKKNYKLDLAGVTTMEKTTYRRSARECGNEAKIESSKICVNVLPREGRARSRRELH